MPHAKQVIEPVAQSSYAPLFDAVWGAGSLDSKKPGVAETYERIVRSIAAYERSSEVNPFSSTCDAYLQGVATLTNASASKGRGRVAC